MEGDLKRRLKKFRNVSSKTEVENQKFCKKKKDEVFNSLIWILLYLSHLILIFWIFWVCGNQWVFCLFCPSTKLVGSPRDNCHSAQVSWRSTSNGSCLTKWCHGHVQSCRNFRTFVYVAHSLSTTGGWTWKRVEGLVGLGGWVAYGWLFLGRDGVWYVSWCFCF